MEMVRRFEFDAAHRLTKGAWSPCHNIHGHRYMVDLKLDSPGLDKTDMVINFSDVKAHIIAPMLVTLDHSIILNHSDESGIIEVCKKNNFKMVLLDGDPTVEVLTWWMQKQAEVCTEKYFSASFAVGITCFETPNCSVST